MFALVYMFLTAYLVARCFGPGKVDKLTPIPSSTILSSCTPTPTASSAYYRTNFGPWLALSLWATLVIVALITGIVCILVRSPTPALAAPPTGNIQPPAQPLPIATTDELFAFDLSPYGVITYSALFVAAIELAWGYMRGIVAYLLAEWRTISEDAGRLELAVKHVLDTGNAPGAELKREILEMSDRLGVIIGRMDENASLWGEQPRPWAPPNSLARDSAGNNPEEWGNETETLTGSPLEPSLEVFGRSSGSKNELQAALSPQIE